jgi:hypothetical protein
MVIIGRKEQRRNRLKMLCCMYRLRLLGEGGMVAQAALTLVGGEWMCFGVQIMGSGSGEQFCYCEQMEQ